MDKIQFKISNSISLHCRALHYISFYTIFYTSFTTKKNWGALLSLRNGNDTKGLHKQKVNYVLPKKAIHRTTPEMFEFKIALRFKFEE